MTRCLSHPRHLCFPRILAVSASPASSPIRPRLPSVASRRGFAMGGRAWESPPNSSLPGVLQLLFCIKYIASLAGIEAGGRSPPSGLRASLGGGTGPPLSRSSLPNRCTACGAAGSRNQYLSHLRLSRSSSSLHPHL